MRNVEELFQRPTGRQASFAEFFDWRLLRELPFVCFWLLGIVWFSAQLINVTMMGKEEERCEGRGENMYSFQEN